MNALRKSLVLATSFAALGVYNSAMAEMVYKPVEQPVEAPNPNLKIEAVNEKFAEKYILANSIRGKRLKKATKSSMQMNKIHA